MVHVVCGYLTGSRFRGICAIRLTTRITSRSRFPLEMRPVEIRTIAVQLHSVGAYLDEWISSRKQLGERKFCRYGDDAFSCAKISQILRFLPSVIFQHHIKRIISVIFFLFIKSRNLIRIRLLDDWR